MNSVCSQILSICILLIGFEFDLCLGSWNHWRVNDLNEPNQRYGVFHKFDGQPGDLYVDQKLDHFDKNNQITWKQRYFVNTTNYVSNNGPVFLLLAGESTASAKWVMQGAWTHYAKDHQALMFQLEHRFYGNSQPKPDTSTENLKYLTSEQAIEDAALFITEMNQLYQIPTTAKWIVFGGSYSATLATWLRLKHPELVSAAVASSAPLKAVLNFPEYFQITEQSITASRNGDECADVLSRAFADVSTFLHSLEGQQILNETLLLCDPVNSVTDKDVSNLFNVLANQISFVVQYNNSAPINTNEICSVMVNKTLGSPLDRLGAVNQLVMNIQRVSCLDFKYDKFVSTTKDTLWSSSAATSGLRQWTFQTCNEFAFFQSSDKSESMFGNTFPVEFIIEQCIDIFGSSFNQKFIQGKIQLTNDNFGALNPDTTNVFTVHGLVDPWHALGLRYSPNHNMPIVYLEGCSHVSDFYEPLDTDVPQLKQVRRDITQWIGDILNEI